MYFSANAGNGFHIWRQRFPAGPPEQVTSGITEEQGLTFFPDGRSFVTSIGVEQNTVWLHDSGGDRQITSQGYAYLPELSPDGKRVYYLLRSRVSTRTWVSGELWVTDLETEQRQRLFPDFLMEDYSISRDGKLVAFVPISDTGPSSVWVASLDLSSPPKRLDGVETRRTVFGPDGSLFYVQGGFLHRIQADGTANEQALPDRIAVIYDISADGKWAAAWTTGTSVGFYPLDGGAGVQLCAVCGTFGAENRGITPPVVTWSRKGTYLYLHSAWTTRETYAIPLQPGQVVPQLPKGGIESVEDIAGLPGAQRIPQLRAFAGDEPSIYLYMRATSQRNIYSVPVP